jgi:proteasome lid subunit RPN8/RPN11
LLIINEDNLKKIVSHAVKEFPNEACGIIAGRKTKDEKIVEKIYEVKNRVNSPFRYEMDPEEQLRIFQEVENESLEVLGFYHTHPHSDEKPSEIDKALAFYEGFSYVIYSVPLRTLASFIWDGKNFSSEKIKVI